jgi:hypothetical protein
LIETLTFTLPVALEFVRLRLHLDLTLFLKPELELGLDGQDLKPLDDCSSEAVTRSSS